MKNINEILNTSYLFASNADFIEALYESYLTDPSSIDVKWKQYFDSLQGAGLPDIAHSKIKQKFAVVTQKFPQIHLSNSNDTNTSQNSSQMKVWKLIAKYRRDGITFAALNPLETIFYSRNNKISHELKFPDLNALNLVNQLDQEFYVDVDANSKNKLKLRDIIAKFNKIYCNSIGFEFEHITDASEKEWLKNYAEIEYLNYTLSNVEKIQLLQKLTEAEIFERYIHTKYVGQKRFSIEGGESLIPALDRLITTAAKHGLSEIVIGMAHRGRLNTLVNIVGKSPQKIFDEFEGNYPSYDFVTSGDVKYHKGHKCNYITENGNVKITLAFNPSHHVNL